MSTNAGSRQPAGDTNGFILTGLILIGLYLCFRFAQPFLPPLVWALTLAIIFLPFHCWLERKLKHPNAAAGLAVLAVALIVVVPAIFVVNQLVVEISRGADALSGNVAGHFERHPLLAPIAGWIEGQFDLPETLGRAATWLTNAATAIVRGSVTQVMGILLTFYLLFYFLRDHRLVLNWMRVHLPFLPAEMERMFQRVADTVHATVYGTLAMAALQGTLGGLMFWILGLPAPLLWGIVMGLLAIIPVLGAFIIWIPAAIWLASQGEWGKALILTAWGGIVVAGIDNLIYPILVGNRLKQHTIVAFIALVGGLILIGSSGIILGPLAVTITLLLIEIRHERKLADKESIPP